MSRDYKRRPPIYVIGPSIAYVPLSKGMFATVDWEDAEPLCEVCWYYMKTGYAARTGTGRKLIRMHKQLLPVNSFVDHANQNKIHNWKGNLRPATKSQNGMNRPAPANNRSGHKGVFYDQRYRAPWKTYIDREGKREYLGRRSTLEQAVALRRAAEIEHFGEFAS